MLYLKIYSLMLFLILSSIAGFNVIADIPLESNDHKTQQSQVTFETFHDWKRQCDKLPMFDIKCNNLFHTPLTEQLLSDEVDKFYKTIQKQLSKIKWINSNQFINNFNNDFQAYVQKLIIPNDSTVAVLGDMHGDIYSLNKYIETLTNQGFLDKNNPFKIIKKNFYFLFLGDYVDRGWYGSEVIYTILRLKNQNPDQVFMVRGNHEDNKLNKRYGFANELFQKFSTNILDSKIKHLYNYLPLAIYLGSGKQDNYNIIQCCHGGIEIGFDPRSLLENDYKNAATVVSNLMQEDGLNNLCCYEINSLKKYFHNNKSITASNGFMWTDFDVSPNTTLELSARDHYNGRMFNYGELLTKEFLKVFSGKNYKLRSIFRGHQHSCKKMKDRIFNRDNLGHDLDIGIGKIWIKDTVHKHIPYLLDDIAVVTFSVAPFAGYDWPVRSFALLQLNEHYKNWRLTVFSEPTKN